MHDPLPRVVLVPGPGCAGLGARRQRRVSLPMSREAVVEASAPRLSVLSRVDFADTFRHRVLAAGTGKNQGQRKPAIRN